MADETGDSVERDGAAQGAMKQRALVDHHRVGEVGVGGQGAELVQRHRPCPQAARLPHVYLAAIDEGSAAVSVGIVDLQNAEVHIVEVDAGDVGIAGAL